MGSAKYFHAVKDEMCRYAFSSAAQYFIRLLTGRCRLSRSAGRKKRDFAFRKVWHEMMDHYYPNSAWLRLGRDAFERLYAYKRRHGLVTWEEAIESLIAARARKRLPHELRTAGKIANAVLYEGFLLYPYRRSSVKNQQRWHFGTRAVSGTDRTMMQTECLAAVVKEPA